MKCTCPICGAIVEVPTATQSSKSGAFPFCSRRCKLIDLGAWLDAEYKVSSGTLDSQETISSMEK